MEITFRYAYKSRVVSIVLSNGTISLKKFKKSANVRTVLLLWKDMFIYFVGIEKADF